LQALRDFIHDNANTTANRVLDDAPILSVVVDEMSNRAALVHQKIAFLNEVCKRNLQTSRSRRAVRSSAAPAL
jgi:hypothetical protein